MEFRYHPIIENLKINEDGSAILLNGLPLNIRTQRLPHCRRDRKVVSINRKTVTTIRLVAEAWIGMPPNFASAARRKDEDAGDHYTNLCWGKQGMTRSSCKGHKGINAARKINEKDLAVIEKRRKEGEKLIDILKDYDANQMAYYRAKKRYGKTKS